MKILFYNHTGKVSGAERVLLMILARLDRERFESVLLCPADGPLVETVRQLAMRVINAHSLEARFTWRPDRLMRYLASFIQTIREARGTVIREMPDIVHANSIRAGLVMSVATVGLRVPIVWHAHDLLPRHPLSSAIRLFACASRRNQVVAVSRAVADRFRGSMFSWFRRRLPIAVIHNAVDLERFQPNHESRAATRRSLGFSEEQLLVGIVGQLTPRKGQLELIDAFARVAQENPNAMLLIVGEALFNRDFEYAESLKETAKSLRVLDRVLFLGQREDIPAMMRSLDLLVVNSRVEPFGLTLIEAMAAGTPVLATAVDGIKEIVRHGEDGWLLPEPDQESLVDAMRTLLGDAELRQRLSREGQRSASRRFARDRFLSQIQALYSSSSRAATGVSSPTRGRELRTDLSAD